MDPDNDPSKVGRKQQRLLRVGRVCDDGLVSACRRAGYELQGFSARMDDLECLITLRLTRDDIRLVAFVGGDNLASALYKAYNQVEKKVLKTREDTWGPRKGGQLPT